MRHTGFDVFVERGGQLLDRLWRFLQQGDDLPLARWLEEKIWPAEARLAGADFVADGALLAAHEMLSGGVTTFNDMYFFPSETARAAMDAGMRAAIDAASSSSSASSKWRRG